MDYKINDITPSEKEIEITYPFDEIKEEFEKEYKKISAKIQVPGFRKGKVPPAIIKNMYGDSIDYEAAEKIASNKFFELAEQQKINYISRPTIMDIKFEKDKELYVKVKYEVMPEVKVDNYKGLTLEIPDFKVGDDEVQKEVEYLLKQNRKMEDAEVVGEDMNYQIKVEVLPADNEDPKAQPQSFDVDLSNQNINKSILEGAKNKKVGDSFEFSFDDRYTEKNEAGEDTEVNKTYRYNAVIKEIKKSSDPELNEEFFKKVSKDKAKTEEELRATIKSDIENYYKTQVDNITNNKLISEIVKANDFDVPKAVVDNYKEDVIKHEEEHQKQHTHKDFDKKAFVKEVETNAEFEVKWLLIRDKIIEKENLDVTEDEIKKIAEEESQKTGIPVDKMLNFYQTSYKRALVQDKLMKFLKESNNIVMVDPNNFYKNTQNEETNA
ncbi:MAG: trigger factor [Syntrophothermus sp.]